MTKDKFTAEIQRFHKSGLTVEVISDICSVSHGTVQRWVDGLATPVGIYRTYVIAELTKHTQARA